jgi:hypothetical protein
MGEFHAAGTFRRHLPRHRVFDFLRRQNLANLDGGHFVASPFRDFVELGAQNGVNVLALRQHMAEHDIANHGA